MKTVMQCAAAAVLFGGLATPVLAATAGSTNDPNAAVNQDQTNSPKMTNLRQQLNNDLTKAGFTDIKVMPQSFLVHAKDSKGNPVIMVINPDSFTEVTEMSAPKNATAGNSENPSGNKVLSGSNANGDPTPPAKQ